MPGRSQFHIRTCDGGRSHLHFPGRTYGNTGDLFAVFGFHFIHQIIIAEHLQAVVRGDGDTILIDRYLIERIIRRFTFQHDGGIP